MAIQIKSAGSKPATRKTATTATPKRRGRPPGSKNKATSTVTAGPDAPKRRGRPPGSKNKTTKTTTAKAAPVRQRRSSKTDMTQAQLNKILKPLARDAAKRTSFHDQWKEYVAKVNEQIIAALDEGVPVNLIVEHGDISRQHVYKLLEDAKKSTNGSGSKAGAVKRGPGRPKGSTNKPKIASQAVKRGPGRPKGSTNKPKPKIRARA